MEGRAQIRQGDKRMVMSFPIGLLQQKKSPGLIKGEECRGKRQKLQRKSSGCEWNSEIPPIVHEVLRSPGQPLDKETRGFFEPRFRHDFSKVRVHADSKAAESAHAVNALAYTVGRDVVFGGGQYLPASSEGRKLLAHELTHVLQQTSHYAAPQQISCANDIYEYEANCIAADIENRTVTRRVSLRAPAIQKSPAPAHAIKTSCDVKIDPRDLNDFLLKKSFRTVGKGQPQVGNLFPGIEKEYPCLWEAGMMHEKQHVQNSLNACPAFKKCVDEHSSRMLYFIGDPKISYDDYAFCYKTHNGGSMSDCIMDEKSAYEASIKKGKELMNEPKCAKEKSVLIDNITYWETIKEHDPDCDANKH